MAKGIDQSHNFGKQNSLRPGITKYPSNATLYTLHSHDEFTEKTENNYPQVHIIVQTLMCKMQRMISFKLNPYPSHIVQTCPIKMPLMKMTPSHLKHPGKK